MTKKTAVGSKGFLHNIRHGPARDVVRKVKKISIGDAVSEILVVRRDALTTGSTRTKADHRQLVRTLSINGR